MVMSEVLPLAEVKAKLSEMVDRVEHTHDRITVTRNGRPAAVLISPDELASLEDTLDLLSDADAMAQLRNARAAVAGGDYVTGDELPRQVPVTVTAGRSANDGCASPGTQQDSSNIFPRRSPRRSSSSCSVRFSRPLIAWVPVAARTRGTALGTAWHVPNRVRDRRDASTVIVLRVDHRSTAYRSRRSPRVASSPGRSVRRSRGSAGCERPDDIDMTSI